MLFRSGTQNPINLVKATVAGLRGLRTPAEVAELRGLSIAKVLGLTERPANGAADQVVDGAQEGAAVDEAAAPETAVASDAVDAPTDDAAAEGQVEKPVEAPADTPAEASA